MNSRSHRVTAAATSRGQRLWLLAFALLQLVGLWQCFGAWLLREFAR